MIAAFEAVPCLLSQPVIFRFPFLAAHSEPWIVDSTLKMKMKLWSTLVLISLKAGRRSSSLQALEIDITVQCDIVGNFLVLLFLSPSTPIGLDTGGACLAIIYCFGCFVSKFAHTTFRNFLPFHSWWFFLARISSPDLMVSSLMILSTMQLGAGAWWKLV